MDGDILFILLCHATNQRDTIHTNAKTIEIVASLVPENSSQVVRRYREPPCGNTPHMLYALQPCNRRLERQDIFTALVTPANVKPGWLVYNQAHQDGVNPPSPQRGFGANVLRV